MNRKRGPGHNEEKLRASKPKPRPRKVAVITARPTQEQWARMSARAAKGGKIIGARPKGNDKGDT